MVAACAFLSPPTCRSTARGWSCPLVWRPLQRKSTITWDQHLYSSNDVVLYGAKQPKQHCLRKSLAFCATFEDQSSCVNLDSDNLSVEEPQVLPNVNSVPSSSDYLPERTQGKPGFVSFYGNTSQRRLDSMELHSKNKLQKLVWLVGPSVLVGFLVIPSIYMRKILSSMFEDSLFTDFLILFFTEALFYGGVAIFVLLVDLVWRPVHIASRIHSWPMPKVFRVSSVVTLVLSLTIPLLTMGLVWPWTGPAASATLGPYLVGIAVQFAFEQCARHRRSPAWPVIPVVFQVYRLHQLNRAAQLVSALSFSLRGAEMTSQTMAITKSLGTLLMILQLLGVICTWSLASFLMRFLPSDDSQS